jgi:hypothetical protein
VPNSAGNSDWWVYAAANVYTNVVSTPPMPWRNPATATEGIVWGRVSDANTGLYVDDATVTVTGGPTVQTDGNGYYIATLVPATAGGTAHSTTVSKTGMTPQTTNAVALAGDIVRYDLTLNAVVNNAPLITTQPQGQTVVLGGTASFNVVATGSTPLAYQWRFNTVPISGATGTAYTRANVQTGDAGSYSVIITNIAGSVISSNAQLTVNVPPAITTQPQSLSVTVGSNATFTVTATGTLPLSYQWQFNSTGILGATGSSFTRSPAQTNDAGLYAVVVTNVAGSVTSSNASLTVNVPPAQPPQIDSISLTPDGPIQLQVSGALGHYAVEATTNLANWAELTNFTTTNTVFQYLDPETNLTQRFYRVRLIP